MTIAQKNWLSDLAARRNPMLRYVGKSAGALQVLVPTLRKLMVKGLIDHRGAITDAGRDALQSAIDHGQ